MKYFTSNRKNSSTSTFLKNVIIILLITMFVSCDDWIEVETSKDNLLAIEVFKDDQSANAAIMGIYSRLRNGSMRFYITRLNSLVSGDVINYSPITSYDEYYSNNIQPSDVNIPWTELYNVVYACNSAIEGLENSTINDQNKQVYLGEAKFHRAFSYFYLLNLFGDVPLITSTDVSMNVKVSRTDTSSVYQQIISDLLFAEEMLRNDYSISQGNKIRANKYSAKSLLARVYLYMENWQDAEKLSTEVIESGIYDLLNEANGVFQINSPEAILQWANNTGNSNNNASDFIYSNAPLLICTEHLLESFEEGDLRKEKWIQSREYAGQTIHYPFKFTTTNINPNEYYTVFRLSEQYLIRAEARAHLQKITEAASDINYLRLKHGGLSDPIPSNLGMQEYLDIIIQQRQVELFTEGMHRWFDLKRTGRINSVMNFEKPETWSPHASLYPIPLSEIQRNPNLTQNPGY